MGEALNLSQEVVHGSQESGKWSWRTVVPVSWSIPQLPQLLARQVRMEEEEGVEEEEEDLDNAEEEEGDLDHAEEETFDPDFGPLLGEILQVE